MDNQQGKTDTADIAWLAGFIDGEGSFMMVHLPGQRLKTMGKTYATPRITLVNTDMPTLEVVRKILASLQLPYHVSMRKGGISVRGNQKRDSWDIRAQGVKRCRRWCEALIPFLHTKRSQAEAMLELCDSRLAGWEHGGGYTENEWTLIEQLRGRIRNSHRLNARPA